MKLSYKQESKLPFVIPHVPLELSEQLCELPGNFGSAVQITGRIIRIRRITEGAVKSNSWEEAKFHF